MACLVNAGPLSCYCLCTSDAKKALEDDEAEEEVHMPPRRPKSSASVGRLERSSDADISGKWMLASYEGDMDAFAIDTGIPWAMRKLANSLGWGVGKIEHTITQDGDNVQITAVGPKGTFTQNWVANGKKQKTVTLTAGTPFEGTPTWQGDEFVVKDSTAEGRRRIENGKLVFEATSKKSGITIKQYFERKS
mmetsp:Transcript_6167/g.14744  ORF Transcript_6167/g.14744 Transcript_6167/m.14744 type:complete len:192 (-) Transcript_6167:14-589(-)